MRRRHLALLALSIVAGCGSPPPALYTLAASPGTPQTVAARAVELRRVALAGYLDRPEIVRLSSRYLLKVSDRERWGEPLGGMIDRVFTEDLVQRLPGTAVYAESGAITARPDLVVEVDVQRFDTDSAGLVVLLAQVAVRHDKGDAPASAATVRLTAAPAGPATADLVAAMSAALGQLADQVAQRLAP